MKKVLLVLGMVALTFSMNAQTVLPTSLQDKQFKWEEKNQGKTFDVQLLSEELSIDVSSEQINSMLVSGVIQAKYKLKNRLSFRPIQVFVYETESVIRMTVRFSGKNAYGVDNLLTSYFIVNLLDGKAEVYHSFTK